MYIPTLTPFPPPQSITDASPPPPRVWEPQHPPAMCTSPRNDRLRVLGGAHRLRRAQQHFRRQKLRQGLAPPAQRQGIGATARQLLRAHDGSI